MTLRFNTKDKRKFARGGGPLCGAFGGGVWEAARRPCGLAVEGGGGGWRGWLINGWGMSEIGYRHGVHEYVCMGKCKRELLHLRVCVCPYVRAQA